jgi:hypothetical protein
MFPPISTLTKQVLFRGVQDSEMKEWEARGLVHAEMGLDWTSVYVHLACSCVLRKLMIRIHWTPNVYNEELFRVFEYGAM